MIQKKIYVLNGHPAASSLNRSLAEAYAATAKAAGHEVKLTHIHDLEFDLDYGFAGYTKHKPLEDCLEQMLADIQWSDHMVLTTPMWWGGLPAKLKGLFDRAFLPGRTFDTRNTNWLGLPGPMLRGRTGRVIITSDTPGFFFRLAYNNAMIMQVKRQILEFVGIKPTRVTHFAGASHPKAGAVEKWFEKVKTLGRNAA